MKRLWNFYGEGVKKVCKREGKSKNIKEREVRKMGKQE